MAESQVHHEIIPAFVSDRIPLPSIRRLEYDFERSFETAEFLLDGRTAMRAYNPLGDFFGRRSGGVGASL